MSKKFLGSDTCFSETLATPVSDTMDNIDLRRFSLLLPSKGGEKGEAHQYIHCYNLYITNPKIKNQ